MASYRLKEDSLREEYEDLLKRQANEIKRQQDVILELQREVTESTLRERQMSSTYQHKVGDLLRRVTETNKMEEPLQYSRLRASASQMEPLPTAEASQEQLKLIATMEEKMKQMSRDLEENRDNHQSLQKMRNRVSELELSLSMEQQGRERHKGTLSDLQKRVSNLVRENEELREQYSTQCEDLQTIIRQGELLQKSKQDMADTMGNNQERMRAMEQRMQENVTQTEQAINEKEAALLKTKHLQREILHLQDTLQKLTAEACEKSKLQLTKAKDERNNSIKRLTQELAEQERRYADLSAEYEELQRLLEKTQQTTHTVESQSAEYCSQYQSEVMELRQRIAELEVTATDCIGREKGARERESKTRLQYNEQNTELGSRVWQLTEQLSHSRSEAEKATTQLRIVKRSRDDEATVAAAEIQLLKNKIDNMASIIKQKKKEWEELREGYTTRETQLKEKYEEAIAKLHSSLVAEQSAYSKLLEDRQSERLSDSHEHNAIVQALQTRLTATTVRANTATSQLAEQTARAEHAQEKLHQFLLKLQECENQLDSSDLPSTH